MTNRGRKRIGFVSHVLPGFANGQGVVLARLLTGVDPESYRFITSTRLEPRPSAPHQQHRSEQSPVYQCRTPWLLRRIHRLRLLHPWVFHAAVRSRAKAIAQAATDSRCQVLVGCTGGDLMDVPATVMAGTMTGLPVYLYYFDDYPEQWGIHDNGWQRSFATMQQATIESQFASRIKGIIVPNEMLADDVATRLSESVPVAVVRNPVDLRRYQSVTGTPRPHVITAEHSATPRTQRILYSGTVYSAQADALENVIQATQQLNAAGRAIEIHIYTANAADLKQKANYPAHVLIHDPVDPSCIADIQATADVLLLPLSFACTYPNLIRTSCPGKFGEYLAAGTPMLIHAPPKSFPITFARHHGCAQVCDTPDVQTVADRLADLLDNPGRAAGFATKSQATARLFDLSLNQETFFSFVNQP